MPKREPTYEELAAERAQEWRVAQAKAAQELAALNERLSQMPDVKGAPAVGSVWEHAGVTCRQCGWGTFQMLRWVTVNGTRHRAMLQCRGCEQLGVWDWAGQCWLG